MPSRKLGSRGLEGFNSIFRGKKLASHGGRKYQGYLTPEGIRAFESSRKELGKLVKWPASRISDADVIEFRARGHEATLEYLRGLGLSV